MEWLGLRVYASSNLLGVTKFLTEVAVPIRAPTVMTCACLVGGELISYNCFLFASSWLRVRLSSCHTFICYSGELVCKLSFDGLIHHCSEFFCCCCRYWLVEILYIFWTLIFCPSCALQTSPSKSSFNSVYTDFVSRLYMLMPEHFPWHRMKGMNGRISDISLVCYGGRGLQFLRLGASMQPPWCR